MNISNTIWLNGSMVHEADHRPSLGAHSLHYGINIFDGIMAYWNDDHFYLHYGLEHYTRFCDSAHKLGFRIHFSPEELVEATHALLEKHKPQKYYVRPLVYRSTAHIALAGSFDSDIENIAVMLVPLPHKAVQESIDCMISSFERTKGNSIPVQWKIGAAYANSFLVRREAEQQYKRDGIMLDASGTICEASAANVFFIKNERLVTPSITRDIFPGITREIIVNLAIENGIKVLETSIHVSQLGDFNGCFLCATLMEIVPVKSIDSYIYQTESLPVFQKMQALFSEIISR